MGHKIEMGKVRPSGSRIVEIDPATGEEIVVSETPTTAPPTPSQGIQSTPIIVVQKPTIDGEGEQ